MGDEADGRVVIKVELDDKEAEKSLDNLGKKAEKKELIMNMDVNQKEAQRNLKNAERRIIGYQEKLEAKGMAKSALVKDLEAAQAEADALDAKLADLRAKFSKSVMGNARGGTIAKLSEAQLEQKAAIDNLQTQRNQIGDRITGINREMTKADESMQKVRNNIAAAENTAGDWSRKLAECEESADGIDRKLKDIGDDGNEADKMLKKITDRIKGLAERVLIFSVITKALRSFRSYMWDVIQTNDEAKASIAKLQGALLTMVYPILRVLIPAFTIWANVLTRVVNVFAQLISLLFGTTMDKSAEAAKALEKQRQGLKGVGSEAKKASKSLASFDEINKLSGDNSGGGSGASGITPNFEQIVQDSISGLVALFTGIALLAVGALFVFTGVNIPLGIAMMVIGAAAVYSAVSTNWDAIKELLQGSLGRIIAGLSAGLLVIGLILVLTKISLPVGLALMAIGAANLVTVAVANWDAIKDTVMAVLLTIAKVLSAAMLVIGAILLFSTTNIPLGLALIAAGVVGLVQTGVVDWETLQTIIAHTVATIAGILSVAALVIGAILTFSGANLPLGIALMMVGAYGIAKIIAPNWELISQYIDDNIAKITAIVGAALLAIGIILLFAGPATLPLGLGLVGTGAITLATAIVPNWDYVKDKVAEIWTGIKQWWNNDVIGGLKRAKDKVVEWGSGLIDGIKNVLGIHSPSTETAQMGDYLMQGMANGINANQYMVIETFRGALAKLDDEFSIWDNNFNAGFDAFAAAFDKKWGNFWRGENATFVTIWNGILDGLQNGINNAIDGLNSLAMAANGMSDLTGKRYKSLGPIIVNKIPMLAQGAVIPPNREFLAVLGDQKQGTNYEVPDEKLRQLIREEMNGGESGEMVINNVLELDGEVIYRNQKKVSKRHGKSLVKA